ncbi:MAG: RNA polymerase factor sigma-54 [Candidatus Methanosuratincola sp.]
MSRVIPQTTPRLVQKQSLVLTQELQLFLKLIQMNTIELREYLSEQLIENPTLEENEDGGQSLDFPETGTSSNTDEEEVSTPDFQDFLARDEVYSQYVDFFKDYGDDELPSWENRVSSAESLLDHLTWQLDLLELTDEERSIAGIIIGNVNEDGYLEVGLEDIALYCLSEEAGKGNLPTSEAAAEGETVPDIQYLRKIEGVLQKLQRTLDPVGVCARNLKECLRIQLENLGFSDKDTPYVISQEYLEELGERNFHLIAEKLGVPYEEVLNSFDVISSLEPKPGRPFYTREVEKHIVPDFYVYKVGDELQLQLNGDLPSLRISQYYRNLIKKSSGLPSETKKYLREKIDAAQRILKCLNEREDTIRRVLGEILKAQRDFFEYGSEYIKPLRLKDVAESAKVHESTVSRITSRRYICTPQGTIQLKALFSRRVETSHGGDVSFERLKSIIREIIMEEPEDNPYSDEDISKILERRNIVVARRTIAKYRKLLNIPSSSDRAKTKKNIHP